jgi:hypothetical protein
MIKKILSYLYKESNLEFLDNKLFGYEYKDNIYTIYLMENSYSLIIKQTIYNLKLNKIPINLYSIKLHYINYFIFKILFGINI